MMWRSRTVVAAASVAMACALQTAALAQEAPGAPPETRVDDVVVPGQALEVVAERFVEAVSAPARTRGLARWDGAVCLGVVNFQADAAHLIIDRMSEVARELGVELGAPGCEPNLVIAGTTDGAGMAREMVDRHRRAFFRYGYTRSNAGSAALETFQSSDAAVRWWHVSLPINVETGLPAVKLPGLGYASIPSNCRIIRHGANYQFCDGITDRLMRLVVIVDVEALPVLTYPQLADYLTMIGLAQIDPGGDWSGFDTVLNVIGDPAATSGLTPWDLAYLDALYSGENERIDADEQAGRLVERLR